MPKFSYNAKKPNGEDVTGTVEADTSKIAVSLLRDRGYIVYSISEKKRDFGVIDLITLNRVSDNEKINFTSNLATMISSGLPMDSALETLYDLAQSGKMKEVVAALLKGVEGGKPLSDTMEDYPNVFSLTYISLVRAGEASGKLDEVLKRLAETLEKQRTFKSKIRGAMLYPTIILIVMLGVMGVIIVFVIPKLVEMYQSFQIELPLSTKMLIWLSDFLRNRWYFAILIIVAVVFIFKRFASTRAGSYFLAKFYFRLPVFGVVLKEKDLTEFSRTLALLTSSGVSIIDSLTITRDAVASPLYKDSVTDFIEVVKKGGALSSAVSKHKNFPIIISKLLTVGEQTGTVDESLTKVSKYFEEEVDRKLEGLTTAIEPIMMVVLGVMVGGLILSVITPIYKLTSSF